MTKYSVGDKVRVIDGKESEYNTGEIVTIIAYDESDSIFPFLCTDTVGDTEWMHENEFELVKPKKSARITTLETQVAALEAKVEALEKAGKYPLTAQFELQNAEVDGILADIKRKAKPTLESILATYPTPNEQRADVIKRAKAFVADLEKRMASDRINREGNHTFKYCTSNAEFHISENKRVVTALVKDVSEGRLRTKGIAKCDPADVFNADIGKAIALARALGVEVPTEFVKAVQPTEVVHYHVLESDIYGKLIVTPTKHPEGTHKFTECGLDSPAANGARITDDTDAVYE